MTDSLSDAPLAPDLLQPALRSLELVVASPALSFRRQVWRRLLRDRRAIAALLVLATLTLATLAGPWWWPIDPARQWIAAAGQGASRAQRALVVEDDAAWSRVVVAADTLRPAAQLTAPQQLQIVEGNTERVRLVWAPVPGAFVYHIYRNTHAPRARSDLGLPLGATGSGGQVGFSDGLLLRQRQYFYSVVASDGVDEAAQFAVVAVVPQLAIAALEAQLQGLLPVDAASSMRSAIQATKEINEIEKIKEIKETKQEENAEEFQKSEIIEKWGEMERNARPERTVMLPAHPLGTDALGRDLLARLLQGARISLFIAVAAALLSVTLGLLYGAVAGFSAGRIDNAMMRFADFVVALPFLLFMILLRIAFGIGPGESGVMPLVIALIALSWPASARLVRGQVLLLREEPYIAAARLAGAGNGYIILRHLLPNMMGVVLVALTFAIPNAIFTEAFLSFIGMGVTPPATSWGAMSNEGLHNLLVHPAELWWPAACISIAVLAFNVMGDALRDALDLRTIDTTI